MRVAPLSEDVLMQLIAVGTSMTEPGGAVLFRRGEPAFGIFVIKTGSVSLRLEADDETVIIDRIAGPQSVVGLPAALSGSRYSLSAVVREESEVTHVNNQSLFDLIKSDSSVGIEIMRALGDEVVQMRTVLASGQTSSKSA